MNVLESPETNFLSAVRDEISKPLQHTSHMHHTPIDLEPIIGGKMLRAQLIETLGKATHSPRKACVSAAAAVEMLHAASLLHDDVVDGGKLRRGSPALWITHGPKVAVLMGDMLLSIAFAKIARTHPYAVSILAQTLRSMCDAEMEQASLENNPHISWDDCLRIARGKTGSLFGFSAYIATKEPSPLADALQTAGIQLGIAYQLADDLLDRKNAEPAFGKTLGTDAATGKYTLANLLDNSNQAPETIIQPILHESLQALSHWPAVQQALQTYIQGTLQPLIETYTTA